MSRDGDGGAAFPCERDYGIKLESQEGMSLRDYFAQAIVSSPEMFLTTGREGKNLDLEPGEAVARAAYDIADSMLVERDK
jgi:hypothetical protein